MLHKLVSDQIGNLLSRVSSKKVLNRLITLDTESPFPLHATIVAEEMDEELDASMRVVRDKVEAAMLDNNPMVAFNAVMAMISDVRLPPYSHRRFSFLYRRSTRLTSPSRFLTSYQANRLYTLRTPWASSPASLHQAVLYSLHSLRIAAILLTPIMPTKMGELLDMMDVPSEGRTWKSAVWTGESEGGGVLGRRVVEGARRRKEQAKGRVLFERIEEEVVEGGK